MPRSKDDLDALQAAALAQKPANAAAGAASAPDCADAAPAKPGAAEPTPLQACFGYPSSRVQAPAHARANVLRTAWASSEGAGVCRRPGMQASIWHTQQPRMPKVSMHMQERLQAKGMSGQLTCAWSYPGAGYGGPAGGRTARRAGAAVGGGCGTEAGAGALQACALFSMGCVPRAPGCVVF